MLRNTFPYINLIFLSFFFEIYRCQIQFEKDTESKTILINKQIIYIKAKNTDNGIYKYDTSVVSNTNNSTIIGNYTDNIKFRKNIYKFNETKIIILGNSYDNRTIYYQIFDINRDIKLSSKLTNSMNFENNVIFLEAKIISEESLLLFLINSRINDCIIFKINTINTTYQQYKINDTSILSEDISYTKSFDCDSYDGIEIFCIINYQYFDDQYQVQKLVYSFRGNISDHRTSYFLPLDFNSPLNIKIIKINNSNNRYLTCYVYITKNFGLELITIRCLYIYFSEVYKLIFTDNEQDICQYRYEEGGLKLILYSYENSIFLQFDYLYEDADQKKKQISRYVIFSKDFNIRYSLSNEDRYSINLFNDNEYLYIINNKSNYLYYEKKAFLNCHNQNSLVLSIENDTKLINFETNHQGQSIKFSLNKNIYFFFDNQKIDSNRDYYTINGNDIFKFQKPYYTNEGIFPNDYMYYDANSFSLICPLNITVCYPSCSDCDANKIGNSTYNYCNKCSTNYFTLYNASKSSFNCYNFQENMEEYYFNEATQKFEKCDESCHYCENSYSCTQCKAGYYFIEGEEKQKLCHNEEIDGYYLNSTKLVYKKCYDHCLSCKGDGNETDNNCLKCNGTYKKYDFDNDQCLKNNEECLEINQYWIFDKANNYINCTRECNDYIIFYDDNRAQCVKDCGNFDNPFFKITNYFSLLNCGGKNYCVPFDVCNNGKFNINMTAHTCERIGDCNIDVFNYTDPFEHDKDIEPTEPTTIITEIDTEIHTEIHTEIPKENITMEIKLQDMHSRNTIFKNLNENGNYSTTNNNHKQKLIQTYIELYQHLKKEEDKIYLITFTKYNNFNITIYPLDIESYAYDNILIPNNLVFANFEKACPNFLNYEIGRTDFIFILVIYLERQSLNSSINDLNYYFYIFNENDINFKENNFKNISQLGIYENGTPIEIIYPLKDYINNNTGINKRNSEYLIKNLKSFYSKDPRIEVYNINDPFYNDICSKYTSDEGVDMTLNDRREEFYVNKSLCEDNCYLRTSLFGERVKSLCYCKIKENISFNQNEGIKDEISSISVSNLKSITCIKETFNSTTLAKNPIFWAFIILTIFLIIMLIAYILYGNHSLKKILKLDDKDQSNLHSSAENMDIDKKNDENMSNNKSIKNSIISEQKSKSSIPGSKNNLIKNIKNKNEFNLNKNKKMIKSLNIYEYKNSLSDKEKNSIEFASEQLDKPNPPKIKELKKAESITTNGGNQMKDLISDDTSYRKKIYKAPSSEISFESYKDEKPILIDTLLDNGIQLKNNYINYPVKFETKQFFNFVRYSLYSINEDDDDEIYHARTFEDDYYNSENNKIKKKNKFNNKRNPKITKLLDGEKLFSKISKDDYISDDYEEKIFYKNKKNTKKDDKYEFGKNYFFDDMMITTKNRLDKKNKKDEETSKSKTLVNEDTSKSNQKRDNQLIISQNRSSTDIVRKETHKFKNRHLILSGKGNSNDSEKENSQYGDEETKNNKKIGTEVGPYPRGKNNLNAIGSEEPSNQESSSFNRVNNLSIGVNESEKGEINKIKHGKMKKFIYKEESKIQGDNLCDSYNLKNNGDNNINPGKNNNLKKKKNKKKKRMNDENNKNYGEGMIINSNDNSHSYSSDEDGERGSKEVMKIRKEIGKTDKGIQVSDKKSEFEILDDKVLGSSLSSFLESNEDKNEKKDAKFILFYYKYFQKRELILYSFFDKKDSIPYFVRWSCFVFCLFFLFMLNCLFLFESDVHERYLYHNNNVKYYFNKRIVYSFYVALIYIVFKMIIIKLLLNKVFKIKKDVKKMMLHSYEKEIDEKELPELKNKRANYLIKYHIKLIIYFTVMLLLCIFIAYFCICYSEIFKNSLTIILLGFLFSFIFSFILCAIICLIIVSIFKMAKKFKNKCLRATYEILSIIY